LFPAPGNTGGRGGRPEKHGRRLVLEAVSYLIRAGSAWRASPRELPPPQAAHGAFHRRVGAGVRVRIHDALPDLVRSRAGQDRLPATAVTDPVSVQGTHTVPTAIRGHDAEKRVNGHRPHRGGRERAATGCGRHGSRKPGPRQRSAPARPATGTLLHRHLDLDRGRLRRATRRARPESTGPDGRSGRTHRRSRRRQGPATQRDRRTDVPPGSANTDGTHTTTKPCPNTTRPPPTPPRP
jgi:transposase